MCHSDFASRLSACELGVSKRKQNVTMCHGNFRISLLNIMYRLKEKTKCDDVSPSFVNSLNASPVCLKEKTKCDDVSPRQGYCNTWDEMCLKEKTKCDDVSQGQQAESPEFVHVSKRKQNVTMCHCPDCLFIFLSRSCLKEKTKCDDVSP